MLVANSLERVFFFKDKDQDIKLADPDDSLSPEAVLNFYSNTYPLLVTAKIEGPEISADEIQYKFTSTMGTKG